MSEVDAVAAVLWVGVTLYAVFGGADFGAGLWDLLAARERDATRPRALMDRAVAPVWEANHVWLIFCLVVLWTGFPEAFAAVMTTLFIPLTLAVVGIVLRGSGFALRKPARGLLGGGLYEALFSVSSVVTPFFMGTVVGAIASGRVPADGGGDQLSAWLNLTSVAIGLLFVASCAYIAAVFLVYDARRAGAPDLVRYFTRRAFAAGAVAGALAIAGLVAVREDARPIFDALFDEGLPAVGVSVVCGTAALILLARGARRGIRPMAVLAVAAVIWGWGLAQYPDLLPGSLTLSEAAAPDQTLITLLVVFGAALLIVVPALALLYSLHQRSLLEGEGEIGSRS
jgi:cytochrome bd ubiquinol oxidase subunit II